MFAQTLLVLAAAPVSTPNLSGNWDLQAGGLTIFRIEIAETARGISATWRQPQQYQTDFESFSRVTGPVVSRPARGAELVAGGVELRFSPPGPAAGADRFRLLYVDPDHVSVTFEGTGIAPLSFVRVASKPTVFGGWDIGRTYVRTISWPTNAEMTAIFDADQADRQAESIDWSVVGPADEKRRARMEVLLKTGALQSGEDFYHAAFLLQHGSVAEDYLRAHLLAVVAIARGKPQATWIAAATLDRYLQAIGKPQVAGTQYSLLPNANASQEPFNRELLSDEIRKALRVPTLSEQERERLKMAQRTSQAR